MSLRDVLVSKPNQAWFELASVAVARQWTDRVLVHGSPDVIPLDGRSPWPTGSATGSSTRGISGPTRRRRPGRRTARS